MKRLSRVSCATAAVLLCLAAPAAWAGLRIECFCAHLNGVDCNGNLICDAQPASDQITCNATFVALVNTCTGDATGTATGCVKNGSRCLQTYINNRCFGEIEGICCIYSSLYTVFPDGKAALIASGKTCQSGGW